MNKEKIKAMCGPCRFFNPFDGSCSVGTISPSGQEQREVASSCNDAEFIEKGIFRKVSRVRYFDVWFTSDRTE